MDWQPIETAPKETPVLIWNGEWVLIGEQWGDTPWSEWGNEADALNGRQPTHWMPLPDPPEARQKVA